MPNNRSRTRADFDAHGWLVNLRQNDKSAAGYHDRPSRGIATISSANAATADTFSVSPPQITFAVQPSASFAAIFTASPPVIEGREQTDFQLVWIATHSRQLMWIKNDLITHNSFWVDRDALRSREARHAPPPDSRGLERREPPSACRSVRG